MTETLQVFRGDNDKHGNANKTPHHTIEGLFAWSSSGKGTAKFRTSYERQESSILRAQLHVARDQDLKQRDRIKRTNGESYQVIGHAMWLEDNPFGYDENIDDTKIFEIEGTV